MQRKYEYLVNATDGRARCAVLLLAAAVLIAAAWLRGAEYDEQYTLFLTAGTARPDWPVAAFPAGLVTALQAGQATLGGIASDLRATDVHPPLYFWAVSLWRGAFGSSLFAARMLSVLCGVISIGLVGRIARRCRIRPVMAMLLTLGCYGFVYTNAVARGFASAEVLTLCGVSLLLGRRPVLAGLCLGAACACNYLAVFVAAAVVIATGVWSAIPAAMPFLAMDIWFFAAQHASRTGQFPPFAVWPSVVRLAGYQVAAVFGGLPLYVDGVWRVAVGAGVGLVAVVLGAWIVRARPWRGYGAIRVLLAAAIAPPVGLLLLAAVFNNTPIELRYLSFGLPFVALLGAASLNDRGRRLLLIVFATQAAGIAGLMLSPHTMQPAR
ncbi:MAG TPA: glycosyltransferase family 39 protein, partial [Rhodopila sp.]